MQGDTNAVIATLFQVWGNAADGALAASEVEKGTSGMGTNQQ